VFGANNNNGNGSGNGSYRNGSGTGGSSLVRTGTDARSEALIGLGLLFIGASLLTARRSLRSA
jgi:hypothetical protein